MCWGRGVGCGGGGGVVQTNTNYLDAHNAHFPIFF